ncbi:Major facilitator superfamily drug efflux transporter [Neorhizobium galegae bv. officinalis bv. officinalis str. HAMBI 1141]|uniref:Major facilitator superfamily drug efflux transporter n=1 Tax=Neorhizobium galegae bv. officinalis bv. officinalis str. HAMBI 1141 TaxID=1028801 RepID=A0A068T8T9_NEOGA|nr:MFS transporter [Neorhizobium galegae]CDN54907.1 Major facilitator superfamily drug efflux transporter [Neorhizobium galegae bv. officinalis bv. officinalis str. HAMBI 1141]
MRDNTHAATAAGRLFVLFAVCCAAAAMPLTFTGTAVGLPAISRALGGSPIALNWATNAFMLSFGSTLMAAGALADSYGRKRIFLSGLGIFALFSIGLAFAGDIVWFDVLRALQGIGAAAAFSGGMASLAQEFDGAARLRAFSIVGASFGIGLAFGPIASGWMIAMFGWPAIFMLVVALAAVALMLGAIFMRESRDPDASGLDWKGALSFTAALTALTFGVLQAPESGWGDPLVIVMLLVAVLVFLAFVLIERTVARPMLDLTLFRYPRFVGVQLLAAAPAYAFVVLLILLPVRFIGIEGMDEIAGGRMMIALSGPLLVLPIAAGLLTRWFAPATICGAGLAISAAGLFWLSQFPVGSAPVALIAPLVTIGVGISLPWGLMDGLAVSVVPKERAGMATGIFSTTRVAGEGVALAVVTAVLSALTSANLGSGAGDQAGAIAQRLVTGDLRDAAGLLPSMGQVALLQGYSHGFSSLLWLLTAITALTAVVVFLFLGRGGETAEDIAEEAELAAAAATRSDENRLRQPAL